MKSRLSVIVLLAVVVCFGACRKKKSTECNLSDFKDPGSPVAWTISGTNITATYPKGADLSGVKATFVVSAKASAVPQSGTTVDLSDNKTVTYTVTAEDGKTTKVYSAKATVSTTP